MTPDSLRELLTNPVVHATLGLGALAVISLLLCLVARPNVLKLVQLAVRRTRMEWDEVVFESRVPHRAPERRIHGFQRDGACAFGGNAVHCRCLPRPG